MMEMKGNAVAGILLSCMSYFAYFYMSFPFMFCLLDVKVLYLFV